MEADRLNEDLQGKKIVSVELGSTPGWIVLNFDPHEFQWFDHEDKPKPVPEGARIFLTIFVGGRKEENSESVYFNTCCLHSKAPGGWGIGNPIRDGRDEEMPMSAGLGASKAWKERQPKPMPEPVEEKPLTDLEQL